MAGSEAVGRGTTPAHVVGAGQRPAVKASQTLAERRGSRWIAPGEVLGAPSFIAVDFETANTHRESACQVAMVAVEHGRVVDRYATLLAPPDEYGYFKFSYLHGIYPRDVRDAPTWGTVCGEVKRFVGARPVFAHNAAFDAGVWRALDTIFGTATVPDAFYCSYRTAQRLVPGLVNYKLPTVTAHLVPNFRLDHHRADSDAEACGLIVAALQSLRGTVPRR